MKTGYVPYGVVATIAIVGLLLLAGAIVSALVPNGVDVLPGTWCDAGSQRASCYRDWLGVTAGWVAAGVAAYSISGLVLQLRIARNTYRAHRIQTLKAEDDGARAAHNLGELAASQAKSIIANLPAWNVSGPVAGYSSEWRSTVLVEQSRKARYDVQLWIGGLMRAAEKIENAQRDSMGRYGTEDLRMVAENFSAAANHLIERADADRAAIRAEIASL